MSSSSDSFIQYDVRTEVEVLFSPIASPISSANTSPTLSRRGHSPRSSLRIDVNSPMEDTQSRSTTPYKSPLQRAVDDNNLRKSLLIKKAVDDFRFDERIETLLSSAKDANDSDLSLLLLEAGSETNIIESEDDEDLFAMSGWFKIVPDQEFDSKYEITKYVLGEGATGCVKVGIDRATKEEVAIKIISASNLLKNSSLFREVNILKRLRHPSIVSMKDVIRTSDYLYIVMELIEGDPLFDYICSNKNNYTEEHARDMMKKVFEAVSYLHDLGIAHRDLKPENIIYSGEAGLKLIDFGLSRTCKKSGMRTPAGTLGYKSPEVFRKEAYDCSVDIWSLGVITYIALCGFPPFFSNSEYKSNESMLESAPFWIFFNESTPELQESILQGQVEFPSPYWSKISDHAKDFISHLLQVSPYKRLTAREALNHPWMTEACIPIPSSLIKRALGVDLDRDMIQDESFDYDNEVDVDQYDWNVSTPDRIDNVENVQPLILDSAVNILTKFSISRKLMNHLKNRPKPDDLVACGILKSTSPRVSATLHAARHRLQRANSRDDLSRFLRSRPSMQDLIDQHIIVSEKENSDDVDKTATNLGDSDCFGLWTGTNVNSHIGVH